MLHILNSKQTQKKKPKVKGKPFNPNFDGNLLAWYDGDTLATDPANTWSDRSTNNFDLTLFNAPSIINNAINGHDALRFDGINQYGQNIDAGFIRNQPQTVYVVFKEITWTIFDTVFNGTGVANQQALYQETITPQLNMFAGNSAPISNPNFVLNTYNIMTCLYNGANSEIRTNNNAAIVGNSGLQNAVGLTIGARYDGTNFYLNGEIAYIILRSNADTTATQNIFINFLKNRFAL